MKTAHFMDTASDIALMIEWYNLMIAQRNNKNILPLIEMSTFFYCSLGIFIWYRLGSATHIFLQTRKLSTFIGQVLFDYILIKALYINIAKMYSIRVLSFVKALRSFESVNESVPQAVLTTIFLIKTQNFTIIPVISLTFSMFSIILRMISMDYVYFKPNWQNHQVR